MATGTRSAKQLEEQVGTLLATLQEQGQRQEQLVRDQANHFSRQLEQLGQEQRDRHAEFSRQFSEQLERLAGDQRQTLEQWTDRQQRMEEKLHSLEEELYSSKRGLLPQLVKSEKSCPESQTSTLNAEASEFLPSTAQVVETGSDGNGTGPRSSVDPHRQLQRPGSYDGRSSWDAYHTQFEMLARINRWKEEEKATYLAVSLKGSALTVLNNIPPESLYSYGALVSALETRFGSAHQAELHRVRFKARLRRRDENLPELAEDIERLARLAYPQTTQAMLDLLAKDQFVDALPDEDMRLRIRQSRPTSLREALRVAVELDSFQQASRQRTRAVRGARMEEKQPGVAGADKDTSDRPQWADDLLKAIQMCAGGANSRGRPFRAGEKKRSTRCWKCGQPGHLQRDCKRGDEEPASRVSPAPTSAPLSQGSTSAKSATTNVTSVYKTGSSFNSCDGLVVEGSIGGTQCRITIDTGSNISIIRPDVLQEGVNILPVSSYLRTVTGATAPIRGRGDFSLQIGGLQTMHSVWVADIADQCILGLDFLESHGCQVDLGESVMHIGNQQIPLQKPINPQPTCYRVSTANDITIPAGSEVIIPGKLDKPAHSTSWGILEPSNTTDLLVGKALVDLQREGVPVRVLNLSDQPRRFKRGCNLATCTPVSGVFSAPKSEGDGKSIQDVELPDFLRSLYERSLAYLSQDQKPLLCSLLGRNADVFSKGPEDLGHTDLVLHKVNTGDAAPIRQPPRRLPSQKKDEAHKAVTEMLQQGLIEPSASPWAAPIVLVRKKDGSWRFCVDYRRLNDVTKKDSYPLPRIDDTLDQLAGMQWFSTLDLKSGYWQVEMDPKDKEKTAFTTGTGLWQFTVMPFGLCNAPATFERLMDRVLAGLPPETALVYIDDILVSGQTFHKQLDSLQRVFQCLRKAKLKLSPKKCHLFQKQVKYLGHVISQNGVSTDPEKVKAVAEWPQPTSTTEVRKFLGLCSYYRCFISQFAHIARPLHQLLECGRSFEWTPAASHAFQQLKQALVEAPVLGYPQPEGKLILDTDASSHAVGAVLSQEQDGVVRPLAYYSQTLKHAERQYCVTRRELLAVIKGIRQFHVYLYGHHFTIRTDHAALRWLLNFRNPEGQVARWLQQLQEYDFVIEHRPGISHTNADALSRRPCLSQSCRHCDRMESKEHTVLLKPDGGPEQEVQKPIHVSVVSLATIPPMLQGEGLEETTDLSTAQEQDPDTGPLLSWLNSNGRPPWSTVASYSETLKCYWSQWDSLRLKDGVLYRLWESPAGDRVVWQIVLPKKLQRVVFDQLHSSPSAGHFGITKTLSRVRERFYWARSHQNIHDWCRSCDLCASKKGPSKKPRAPMRQYNAGAPTERIALDILGPLPISENGNKYLLVVSDYFTKWPEAYPLPNQEAITVAESWSENLFPGLGYQKNCTRTKVATLNHLSFRKCADYLE